MTLQVQLFITCLGEQFYPATLEKMVLILERQGVTPIFPAGQTCCGQPMFNSGFQSEARKLARNWLSTFSQSDAPIVSPSGSCVDMVRSHYPHLFPPDAPEHAQAAAIAARIPYKVTYHASCHYLRGLGLRQETKQLLAAVRDIELIPLAEEDVCCGFGGVFSVIYPEVSRAMMEGKVRNIIASGADAVVACDAGCLMNIGGGLRKAGSSIQALHIIDVLASDGGKL
jgi:L-lactate dehydrogenase complex protein LldE